VGDFGEPKVWNVSNGPDEPSAKVSSSRAKAAKFFSNSGSELGADMAE
jgi:hypothetical protein